MATEAKPRAAMDVSTSLTSLPRDRSERNSVQSTRGNSSREKWRNIMGRGRQCPTCNGTGTIPKGDFSGYKLYLALFLTHLTKTELEHEIRSAIATDCLYLSLSVIKM